MSPDPCLRTLALKPGSSQIGNALMSSMDRRVVFGLGSNLQDRVDNVLSGARSMASWSKGRDVRLSPLYETSPVGGPPQGDFINAALSMTTDLPARTLLAMALAVEQQHGRYRSERWGPRTLDIDVLWVCGEIIDEPGLQVPHPMLLERAFALKPLLDLEPAALDPRSGLFLREAMQGLSTTGMACCPIRPDFLLSSPKWVSLRNPVIADW